MRFRKKPEEVEAWRFYANKMSEAPSWVPNNFPFVKAFPTNEDSTSFETAMTLQLISCGQPVFVREGQWIVKDRHGDLLIYAHEDFHSAFDLINDWYGLQAYDKAKGVPFLYQVDEGEDRCTVRFESWSSLYGHMEQILTMGRQTNRNSVHALIRDTTDLSRWTIHSNFYLTFGPKEDEVLEPFRTSLEEDILLLHNTTGNDYFTLIKPGLRFDMPILKTKIGTFRLPLREKAA